MAKLKPKEVEYIKRSAKMCKYIVNIEAFCINVPLGEEPDMTAEHLKNKFGMLINYIFDDDVPVNERVFDPTMATNNKVIQKAKENNLKELNKPKFVRPETFEIKKTKQIVRIYGLSGSGDKVNVTMQYIDSLNPNFIIKMEDLKKKVDSTRWIYRPDKNYKNE